MRQFRLYIALCLSLATQGCAYLTHYQASVGDPSTGVSMDAKQRLLLVNSDPTNPKSWRRMCAEPSPDALSALGASFGVSLLGDSEKSKQISGAMSEAASSIGLRTTAIQLMRDAMYRVCESYLNGAVTPEKYASMQEQGQAMVVGLLAIEQLTRAVKSDTVVLTSSAGAGGLPNTDKEYASLDAAQLSAVQKTAEKVAAESAAALSKTAYDAKMTAIGQASAEAKPTLEAEAVPLKTKAEDDARAAASAGKSLELAERREKDAQAALAAARTRVTIATNTMGKVVESGGTPITDASAKTLSDAVTTIVTRVISRSDVETCLALLSDPAVKDHVKTFCDRVGQIKIDTVALELQKARNQTPK